MSITDTITTLGKSIINLISTKVSSAISTNNAAIESSLNNLQEQINNVTGDFVGVSNNSIYITEVYTSETDGSGYILYSNGLCEQWGSVNASTTSVTLLIPYINNTYYASVTGRTGVAMYASAEVLQAEGFTIHKSGSYSCGWRALGFVNISGDSEEE